MIHFPCCKELFSNVIKRHLGIDLDFDEQGVEAKRERGRD